MIFCLEKFALAKFVTRTYSICCGGCHFHNCCHCIGPMNGAALCFIDQTSGSAEWRTSHHRRTTVVHLRANHGYYIYTEKT